VSEIDQIHHHMTVDVRFRTGPGFSEPRPDGQPLEAAKKTNGVAPATGTGTGSSAGGGGLARHASE
jgi:hypothetical protein